MPALDMPLEKLLQYQGSSPCPKDFDAFWDKAVEEMKAVDPKTELVKSKFQVPFADCYDLYFTGVRGARIHAKYLKPKNVPEPHPAVIQFHGYTWFSGDWNEKLNYVACGFSVIAMDCRGQGGYSEDVGGIKGATVYGQIVAGLDDKPENLLFRQHFLDAAQLAGIVMDLPEVDENRVGVMGGSQGGALTVACAALEPRVKRLAPVYPYLSDYRRVWEMDLAKDAYDGIAKYFRFFDPTHEREDEIFEKLGYIDIQNLAGRIKGEVLMGATLMDNICPPSTQFAVYNKIKAPKDIVIYPDHAHEFLPGFGDRAYAFMLKL